MQLYLKKRLQVFFSLHSDVTMKMVTDHTQSVHTQAVNNQDSLGYQTRMLGGVVLSGLIFAPTHQLPFASHILLCALSFSLSSGAHHSCFK